MTKIDQTICRVFLCGLPVVVLMALASSAIDYKNLSSGSMLDLYNSFSGLVFGVWMTLSIYLSARLILSYKFRSGILPRLAFFRERDEREMIIAGRAARNSFLTTLALLIFFLCLSAFQVAIYRVSPEQAKNGKTGMLTLGIDMNLIPTQENQMAEQPMVDYFRYKGLPFSNFAVILLLILWQIGSYNYFARRIESQNADPLEI